MSNSTDSQYKSLIVAHSDTDTADMSDLQVEKKISQSTQAIPELRVSPFLPIDKISEKSLTYKNFVKNKNILRRETKYGTVSIRNRLLTQRHKEIFDCIMAFHRKSKILDSGEVVLYFTLYDIAKHLKLEWNGRCSKQLQEDIEFIGDVVIQREDTRGRGWSYNIINHFVFSKNEDMWVIVLSKAYTDYFKTQISINYEKKLPELMAIKGSGSALIKAIIDFFITHDVSKKDEPQRIGLILLLETVGYPLDSPRQLRRAKEYISANEETFKKFSIYYNSKEQLYEYFGMKDLVFIPPVG